MERATQERLVGAVILVFAVIALVPAILTGPKAPVNASPARETALKSLEIDLVPPPAPSEAMVPEPVSPAARPVAPPGTVPAAPTGLPPAAAPAAAGTAAAKPGEQGSAAPAATSTPASPAPVRRDVAPTADPNAAWAVQLGAFSSQSAADKLVKDLRARGYPAFIVDYRADGRVLHRVRVGPEQDRGRADALAARLAKDGFKGNVARHP
jgi:DedD protein